MKVSHVGKYTVEKSHTTPSSICKEYFNHSLGLTLSTPGLVMRLFRSCSDPEVDRDSDDIDIHDTEPELDDEDLDDDCFLEEQSSQDTKSLR